jgi:ribonuclease T
MTDNSRSQSLSKRFRGFLPVVVDLETGGLNPNTDALLEIAVITVKMDTQGLLMREDLETYHVLPFEGAHLDPESLALNKIDPFHPFRFAIEEREALEKVFSFVNEALKRNRCRRAILVGHNAWFDLFFLKAAVARCRMKHMPFHSFSTLDTASLSALVYGQTVLARACAVAGIPFDRHEAHSAIYDAEQTTKLFCGIVNRWTELSIPQPTATKD